MKRLLLLAVGAVLVAALILAPPPTDEALFEQGVANLFAGDQGEVPTLLSPLSGLLGEGEVTLHLAAIQTAAGTPLADVQAQVVRDALQRAVNHCNNLEGVGPLLLVEDPAAAAVALSLQVADLDVSPPPPVDAPADTEAPASRKHVLTITSQLVPLGDTAPLVDADGKDSSQASGRFLRPSRLSLLPPLLAIALAIAFRKVLLALLGGVWLAAGMLTWNGELGVKQVIWNKLPTAGWWKEDPEVPGILTSISEGFLRTFDTFFHGQLVDGFRIEIIAFTMFLAAAVGVMSRSGGMTGLVHMVMKLARGVRSSQFATWLMGVLVFFDDYANCIVVGNSMRPLTDRRKIAREKLAFIVDATAAPVAALCIVSTWIAFEVSTFSAQLPSAVTDGPYEIFLQTLPYRYYAIFMLGFVLLTILLQRDFGPMLAAERRARRTGQLVRPGGRALVSEEMTRIDAREGVPPLARRALLPILTVLLVTLATIWVKGGGPHPWKGLEGWQLGDVTAWSMEGVQNLFKGGLAPEDPGLLTKVREIIAGGADAGSVAILYGSFSGLVVALFLASAVSLRIGLVLGWLLAGLVNGRLTQAVVGWVKDLVADPAYQMPAADAGSALDRLQAFAVHTLDKFTDVFHYPVFLGAFFCGTAGVGILVATILREDEGEPDERRLKPGECLRSALAATRAMALAICILFLAWMIGEACTQMGTASYLVAQMSDRVQQVYWLLPTMLFLTSCLVAFSTGSSWSTMGILLPVVVGLAYAVGEQADGITGHFLMVLSIGAVLEGSIFGDHCSPISDTTVLSSTACASDHIDHVRTQMPYAVLVMVVSLVIGYIPQALGWWSWQISLIAGLVVLALVLVFFGRRPDEEDTPDVSADLPGESGGDWSPLPAGTDPPSRREPLAAGLDELGRPDKGPPWFDE